MESNNNVAALLHQVKSNFQKHLIPIYSGSTFPCLAHRAVTLCRLWYSPLCRLLWFGKLKFIETINLNKSSWQWNVLVSGAGGVPGEGFERTLPPGNGREVSLWPQQSPVNHSQQWTTSFQGFLFLLRGRRQPRWLWAPGAFQVGASGSRGMDWAGDFWTQGRGKLGFHYPAISTS